MDPLIAAVFQLLAAVVVGAVMLWLPRLLLLLLQLQLQLKKTRLRHRLRRC